MEWCLTLTCLDRCAQATMLRLRPYITQPTAGANVTGVNSVRAQATDDVRVEKVDLWVDGVLSAIDTQAPYEFSWDTTKVPERLTYDRSAHLRYRRETRLVGRLDGEC